MANEHNNKRPTAASMLNIAAFCTALFAVGGLSIAMEKPTYSEQEKRDLAKMPELTLKGYRDGSLASGIDAFYSDTFPFRDALISLGSTLEEMRGLRLDDAKIHETAPSTSEPEVPTEPGSGTETENSSSSKAEETAVGEQNGSVFIYKGMAMSMFGGSQSMGKWYADVINSYAAALPDVQVYDIVVPTSIEFYLPEKYQDISAPEKPNIDYIYSQMSDAVKTVDAYGEIAQHTDEYIYFRTDHHWTVTGAYYAYVAFCKEAGFTPTPYDSFEWNRKEPFYGTLYSQTQDSTLRENPDYVDYPTISTPHQAYMYKRGEPFTPYASTIMADYASGVNMYSVFLHGDQPLTEIQTENKNGRKAVVVKESFGNAFSPFLVAHYETVYIVDQRYFELNLLDFIKQNGVTDLIFINNVFAANTAVQIQWIQGLMTQQWAPPVQEETEESEEETESSQEPEDGEEDADRDKDSSEDEEDEDRRKKDQNDEDEE